MNKRNGMNVRLALLILTEDPTSIICTFICFVDTLDTEDETVCMKFFIFVFVFFVCGELIISSFSIERAP